MHIYITLKPIGWVLRHNNHKRSYNTAMVKIYSCNNVTKYFEKNAPAKITNLLNSPNATVFSRRESVFEVDITNSYNIHQ